MTKWGLLKKDKLAENPWNCKKLIFCINCKKLIYRNHIGGFIGIHICQKSFYQILNMEDVMIFKLNLN